MEKKFEHTTIERCILCKKDINTDKERWCCVLEYAEHNKTSQQLYHQSCLKDLVTGKGKVIEDRLKNKMGDMLKKITGSIGGSGGQMQEVKF